MKHEQLFKLKSIYDFSITEYDPKIVDECDEIENLLAVENYDLYGLCCANLKPLKITHNYDYSGNEKYISGLYIFNHKGEIKLKNIKWSDIECGNITLNENKSFRDVKEIISQINRWRKKNER